MKIWSVWQMLVICLKTKIWKRKTKEKNYAKKNHPHWNFHSSHLILIFYRFSLFLAVLASLWKIIKIKKPSRVFAKHETLLLFPSFLAFEMENYTEKMKIQKVFFCVLKRRIKRMTRVFWNHIFTFTLAGKKLLMA